MGKTIAEEWIEAADRQGYFDDDPESVEAPAGREDTVEALARGKAEPGDSTTAALAESERSEVLRAAATRCERKSSELDKTPGDTWSAAQEKLESRAEELRDAAGGSGTDGSADPSSSRAALSAEEREERAEEREAEAAARKRERLKGRIEREESMVAALESAASSENVNDEKAREHREKAAELRDRLADLQDSASAPASYATGLLRAALTGESAEESFVRTDDGVTRVVESDDGVELDTEADDTRAALSVPRFNAAASGVQLTEQKTAEGPDLRIGNVVAEDTELPAIETRHDTAALGASDSTTAAASSNSGRIRELEEKRDKARQMPGEHWDAAAREAQDKIDNLRGDN